MIGLCYLLCTYMEQKAREKRKKRECSEDPEGYPMVVLPLRCSEEHSTES